MIPKKNGYPIGSLLQFSPCIIFLVVYCSLFYYMLYTKNIFHSQAIIFAGLPLFATFVATVYACFTFKNPLNINEKIKIFLSGAAHVTAMNYYFNIIFIAIFNYMMAKTNGVLTAVTLGLLYIPTTWIMPIMFLMASIFSILISSQLTSTLICIPIAYGIAQSLHINTAFMTATIISGALFGAHISLYFKNIALTDHFNVKNIFQKTYWFIIAAGTSTLLILSQYQCQEIHPTVYNYLQTSIIPQSYITILPYCCLLLTRYLKINLLVNLVIANCLALIINITLNKILFLDAIATMFSGFYKDSMIVTILFLHLLLAGLTKIIQYNGGFIYMIENLKIKENQTTSKVQASIILITMITNICIIIDRICLSLLTQPIKQYAHRYNITQNKITSLLYITTTTMQSILPYATIMFITINITQSSYIEIIQYMIYPGLLATLTTISIFI
ncbi:MAG: hypothetical protein Q8Q60_03220 [Candidatus Chromulinivorax sp.]|nr:hypothetical protein [Candidatus Chromulinivorax sp.]